MKNKKLYNYHYFYKITNNLNGHFYYGVHSTNNLNDGYMGSGTRLRQAYKKYGIENFKKEILYFFNSEEEALNYEAEIVNESLVKDLNCYNISRGGQLGNAFDSFTAFDKQNNQNVRITYSEYELNKDNYIGCNKDKIVVRYKNDINGSYFIIPIDEYNKNKDKYFHCNPPGNDLFSKYIIVTFRENPGEYFFIERNEYNKKIYITPSELKNKNYFLAKDKNNNIYKINKNDERYLSGELTGLTKGYIWSEQQKEQRKKIFKKIKHQQGEKNSQFGTKWIYKDSTCIKVKKEELETYLNDGWQLGNLNNRKKL